MPPEFSDSVVNRSEASWNFLVSCIIVPRVVVFESYRGGHERVNFSVDFKGKGSQPDKVKIVLNLK